jgi:hypothetical protein
MHKRFRLGPVGRLAYSANRVFAFNGRAASRARVRRFILAWAVFWSRHDPGLFCGGGHFSDGLLRKSFDQGLLRGDVRSQNHYRQTGVDIEATAGCITAGDTKLNAAPPPKCVSEVWKFAALFCLFQFSEKRLCGLNLFVGVSDLPRCIVANCLHFSGLFC